MFYDENPSLTTAENLIRWFKTFQNDIEIDIDQLNSLTSNSNLNEIWKEIIRHFHPVEHVKKVKETLRIHDLKQRHPDRWEQHKTAQLQQNQIEQRISLRLREINSNRCEQSTNIFNELNRLQTMIDEEFHLINSLDKQYQVYQQIFSDLNQLEKFKTDLHLLTNLSGTTNQNILQELIKSKTNSIEFNEQNINLNDLCLTMNHSIQQRIHQINKLEKDIDEQNLPLIKIYEDSLNKINLEFTKQFVHLSNIHLECLKVRNRLEESKRDVLSKRSINDQNQLLIILDAMISSKSIDVHLSLLKKKIQNEIEETKKFDENSLSILHQQINEKRNELNRIDQQLNKIVQENPFEKLEKIELKIRDFIQIFVDLPTRFHSLNIHHLSLSNEIRSNIFNWSMEQFSSLNFNHSIETNQSHFLSPISSKTTSTTPLTSLKQLLGIRTQDTIINQIPINNEILSKEENQRWQIELNNDDQILRTIFPTISNMNWNLLTRVDQQIEDSLKHCQQDFHQYQQIFENVLKEIKILHSESLNQSIMN